MISIDDAIKWGFEQLKPKLDRARFESEQLLAYHLRVNRIYLLTHGDKVLEDFEGFSALVARRANDEPFEYITSKVSFYDIELEVEHGVLIPRPETEILIDKVAEIIEKNNITTIAEIGVGSGAISIVLARKFPNLHIISSDISPIALNVARKNIASFNLEKQIILKETNLLDGIEQHIELIVSNPPYIANDEILEKNVKDYEPHIALFGGVGGHELLYDIVDLAINRKVHYLCCEMGCAQKEVMESYFKKNRVKSYSFYKDLASLDRGFCVEL